MRKLLLVRGPQGSGKSTLIAHLGLAPYALSLDTVRQVVAAPTMTSDGRMSVAGEFDEIVLKLHRNLVTERMKRGELMVIEQAVMLGEDVERYIAMGQAHGYVIRLVDLTNMPLDQVLAQNASRSELTRVPAAAVRRTHWRLSSSPLPSNLEVIPWSTAMEGDIQQWLSVPLVDLSAYDAVVHIGDIQGCHTVLAGPEGPLRNGLDPKKFYIFVGDLLDRGLENGQVFRWYLDEVYGRPNSVLLFGNHELHPARWAAGEKALSQEFNRNTLPQLLRAGITREDAAKVTAAAHDVFPYTYLGHKVMVTHAGLPTVPTHFERIASFQYQKGTGAWSDPVDVMFQENAPVGWVQVHGHRNNGPRPVQASERSFNLEDAVEHGGSLRLATLDATGWSTQMYPNPVFKPYRERKILEHQRNLEPSWMGRSDETYFSPELLEAMRNHPGVRERVSESHPHIASLNFTRNVFWEKSWDELVMRARGLFFNRNTGEIVARAYDKFFNLDERPETKLDAVMEGFKFPIHAYRKDNGFLGLIGYDRTSDSLFFSSKSTPDSPFTGWLRTIYDQETTPIQRESLRRYLRDMEACVAVEAIDPVNDPHLIDYDRATLTVLDVFHRSTELDRLPFDKLADFAQKMGLQAKTREFSIKSPEQLSGWYNHVSQDLTYRHRHRDLEGFVLEDADAKMVKIKLPHYGFWKTMRSTKDRLGRLRRVADEQAQKGRPGVNEQAIESTIVKPGHPLAEAFLRWTLTLPTVDMERSILDLRQAFKKSFPTEAETFAKVPWAPVYEKEEAQAQVKPSADPAKRAHRGP